MHRRCRGISESRRLWRDIGWERDRKVCSGSERPLVRRIGRFSQRNVTASPTIHDAAVESLLDGDLGSTGELRLQAAAGTTAMAAAFRRNQVLDHLNAEMSAFISRMEMAWIATSDLSGAADCSFRAGPPGFVRVLDRKMLAYPEYWGNGVLASLANIEEQPHASILFLDFLRTRVGLHVNGWAEVLGNAEMAGHPNCTTDVEADLAVTGGRHPQYWVLVTVVEAYIHCSKHVPLLIKAPTEIDWGTDDTAKKGGDAFRVAQQRRAARNGH